MVSWAEGMTMHRRLFLACRRGLLPGIAALLFPHAAAADAEAMAALTADRLAELPFEQLLTLQVSSASHYPQKVSEAPSAAVVVTAEDIRTFGHRSLADVLRSMPGLHVSHDRSWSYLGVRGFSRPGDYNTRVLLLVDGYRVNDNIYNQAYVGSEFLIDMELIERVEFIPGPGASAYGDNAFFGVINVITQSAAAEPGVAVTAEAGSHDAYRGGLRYAGEFGNGASVLLSASHAQSHGRDWYYPEFGARARGLDHERNLKLFARLDYLGWTMQAGYMRRPKGNPTAPYGTLFGDDRMETVDTHAFATLGYRRHLSEHTEISGSLYYGHYGYDGAYPYAGTLNVDRSRGRRAGGELRLLSGAFAGHTLMAGIEYQRDLRQDQKNYDLSPHLVYLDERQQDWKFGLYLQDEILLREDLRLNAGLRYDHAGRAGGDLHPRLALIYHPHPGNSLKLIYGSAYRAPNAYELYYGSDVTGAEQKGNPGLRPETIRTYEAVLERTFAAGWHGTVSLYHYRVADLITQIEDPLDGRLVFRNDGRIHATGMEVAAEKRWSSGVRLKASLGYQEAKDRANHEFLVNSPRELVKLALSAPLGTPSWRAGLEAQYTGERKTLAASTGGYTLANLVLSGRAVLPGLDLTLGIYNLLDRKYADPADRINVQDTIRQDGRTLRLKMDYWF